MGKTCKFCDKLDNEDIIRCASCKEYCHPSCLELPKDIVPRVRTYDWQCNDCKYCYQCEDIENEEKILFCDACDRGYHMYCVTPKLKKKPIGKWFCPICENMDSTTDNKNYDGQKKPTSISESQTEKPTSIPKSSKLKCPFPGCTGSGNVKSANSGHISINHCPLARGEEQRERELLGIKTHKQKETKDIEHVKEENYSDSQDEPTTVKQTAIEHIVSTKDLQTFDMSKEKAKQLLQLNEEIAPTSDGLKVVVFGQLELDAWYKSQYPLEFVKLSKIYVCEFCLQYLKSETICSRHMAKCSMRNPPGDEIYRNQNLSVFEVDGQKATIFCRNLCLFAKLFLDHKTLWADVEPFLFYIMTVADNNGCHIIGYFSKEKVSFLNYNVSCILVFPQHMRKGYGKMLIEFSYLLSKVEGRTGSPEKPLSDLGLMSYRNYWQDKLLNYLLSYSEPQISIKGISERLGLHPNDVISTLQFLGMLKYWKGKHLILLKKEIIEEYATKVKDRPLDYKQIDPSCLAWTAKKYQH